MSWFNCRKKVFYESDRCSVCKCIFNYKQRKHGHEILLYSLFCIALLCLSCIVGCRNENTTSFKFETDKTVPLEQVSGEKSEFGAILAAKKFVVNKLESRNTVKFPEYNSDVARHANSLFLVRSYVDTRNDCGPIARRYFTCLLRFEKDKWILEELEFY